MKAEDLARLSTIELIQRFAAAAKATPTVCTNSPTPEAFKRTPERAERVAQMQALGAILRDRRSIEDIRPLFEDMNPDVRNWAAGQFHAIDPEWSEATFSGLAYDLSTREAFDLTRRVRQKPPSCAALRDMSDDALAERFEDAAAREYATKFLDYANDPQDMAVLNRILDEVWAVAKELKRRGATAKLLPLLNHRFDTVRREAARECLRVAPNRAEAALEAIAGSNDVCERARALDVLNKWRDRGAAKQGPTPS